ncbi:MAG: hypothetical protein AAGA62_05745, partial [Bacteroidota bacterium]
MLIGYPYERGTSIGGGNVQGEYQPVSRANSLEALTFEAEVIGGGPVCQAEVATSLALALLR